MLVKFHVMENTPAIGEERVEFLTHSPFPEKAEVVIAEQTKSMPETMRKEEKGRERDGEGDSAGDRMFEDGPESEADYHRADKQDQCIGHELFAQIVDPQAQRLARRTK
jgi:hypothetical protein